MFTFSYWDNKNFPKKLLLKVFAESILVTDEQLKQQTGHVAVKCPWIGCTIEKQNEK